MNKIGFVIPWFAEDIPGGAESELRGLTHHLNQAGVNVEILTTCVKEATADWNIDYYPEGLEIIQNIPVRRFKVKKGDKDKFNHAMGNIYHKPDFTLQDEDVFLNEMVNSTELYQYIKNHEKQYDLFVFIPYLFGTTYHGILACPEKAVMIPCFHDEPFIHIKRFKEAFSMIQGMAFLSNPEMKLAQGVYCLDSMEAEVLGAGVETKFTGCSSDFVEKYSIKDPFILYAGRKDKGKNTDMLIQYFEEYKKRNATDLKLVLVGGGEIEIPDNMASDIIDLGYISDQDKYNAYSAALALCQPSRFESFSIVIMESWLCKRPVLVFEPCKVTTYFAKEAMGGLYFNNYFEFEGCLNFFRNHPDIGDIMGENGREFVMKNFDWDVMVRKYKDFFARIINKRVGRKEYNETD